MGRCHAGRGAGRSPLMRRRIFWNKLLGTAISANWKVTLRPWRTTLAPILTGFSRGVVSDQCSTFFRVARVRLWLYPDSITAPERRPLSCAEPTFKTDRPLCPRFRLLHLQERTFVAMPPFVCS